MSRRPTRSSGAGGPTARDRAEFGPITLKTPGSVEWCWSMIQRLKLIWMNRELARQHEEDWRRALAEATEQRVWEKVPPDRPYGSFEALAIAELGMSADDLAMRVAPPCGAASLAEQISGLDEQELVSVLATVTAALERVRLKALRGSAT